MTRKPHIESSISAIQNRGGYGCHAVIDNPLDKTYRTLSWLLAAASAFVCSAIGSALGATAEYPLPLHFTPYTEQGLAQSDKGSLPLHFTPYTRITTNNYINNIKFNFL